MASWKSRCPLKWSRKTKIDIDNVLHSVHKGKSSKHKHIATICTGNNLPPIGAESSPDGTREHTQNVYKDKRCKITMKFDVQGNPQSTPLSERLKSAEVDAKTVESIRDRLGTSVTYLEGVLAFGNLVKDVSYFISTDH